MTRAEATYKNLQIRKQRKKEGEFQAGKFMNERIHKNQKAASLRKGHK